MCLFRRAREKGSATVGCSCVVVAAGRSERMQGIEKVLYPLLGVPVLIRTLQALSACEEISEIIVVTREDLLVPVSDICKDACLDKVRKIVVGAADRAGSVRCGLREIDPSAQLVAVHDAARPFVTPEVVREAILTAARTGAAAPAVRVKDTVKVVGEDGMVDHTPPRETLWAVQTPQVFDADLLRGALIKAEEDGAALTDDCSAVERIGMKVTLTPGCEENIKLTTPVDLACAEAIISWRERGGDT